MFLFFVFAFCFNFNSSLLKTNLEVFPFFFVNGAAALVGVRCRTFIAATSVSCVPGSVIYTTAGGALANLLHKMSDDEENE